SAMATNVGAAMARSSSPTTWATAKPPLRVQRTISSEATDPAPPSPPASRNGRLKRDSRAQAALAFRPRRTQRPSLLAAERPVEGARMADDGIERVRRLLA